MTNVITDRPPVRRNRDGQRNLQDLRQLLRETPDRDIRWQGGWILCAFDPSVASWREWPAHPADTERAAIERVLCLTD